MLIRWLALAACVLLLTACTDADLNIPDRDSMGMSQPLIEIFSPAGNEVLPADAPFTLDYNILRSTDGHHVKIQIDDGKPQTVVRLKGKHRIHGLPEGKHRIRITEYTRDGRKTGGDITLTVIMQAPVNTPATDASPAS